MNLIHPTTFHQQPTILTASPQVSYIDNSIQLATTVSMHFGFFINLKSGEFAMQFPDLTPKIQSQFADYNKVRYFLNICANTGEAVDDSLLQLLEKIFPKRKAELAKMDFSKRRDELSEVIKKSEIIKGISEFDSHNKRKSITTTFANFVKLRNYYTHGKLILKYDSEQYYIQVVEKLKGDKVTYGIDRKILTSFINTGVELISLLSVILNKF